MSDVADRANEVVERELALTLSAARATMVPGVEGECDNCERQMRRLVGGLCGFCRDGRKR